MSLGPFNLGEEISPATLLHKETKCLFCQDLFNLNVSKNLFLQHLQEVHQLYIENVCTIEDFEAYVNSWQEKLIEHPIRFYIQEKNGRIVLNNEGEDRSVRNFVQLDYYLKQQHFERTSKTLKKKCLLCRLVLENVTRHEYVAHLQEIHNLHLGNPNNLIYIDELVKTVEGLFEQFICLFCLKKFPDIVVLKEHMRKKIHKRINSENSNFDRFFICNYINKHRDVRKTEKPEKDDEFEGEEDSFIDWVEKEENIYCLFCTEETFTNVCDLYKHMENSHGFDFLSSTKNFDIYKKIKFVNFVRKQMNDRKCLECDFKDQNLINLREHMKNKNHLRVPEDVSVFNQPEFYFPTFENDALLYLLDVEEDDNVEEKTNKLKQVVDNDVICPVCEFNCDSIDELKKHVVSLSTLGSDEDVNSHGLYLLKFNLEE